MRTSLVIIIGALSIGNRDIKNVTAVGSPALFCPMRLQEQIMKHHKQPGLTS